MADKEIQFKFSMSDGTTMQSNKIVIPSGQPAPTVKSAEIENFSLETCSWSQISEIANSGKARRYFNIGESKKVTFTNGLSVDFAIIGFDHDDLSTGSGKAGITFGAKTFLYDQLGGNIGFRSSMANSASNAGGWSQSKMRLTMMPTIFGSMPDDLREAIVPVVKKTTAGSQSSEIVLTDDKLWLYSRKEIDNDTLIGYSDEGEQYEYWRTIKNGSSAEGRIITYAGKGGSSGYLLRTPYTGDNLSYVFVSYNGNLGELYGSTGQPFPIGFCIGVTS